MINSPYFKVGPNKSLGSSPRYIVSDIILFLLFLVLSATLIFRVKVEATGYLSPDSKQYLELAQSLKDGQGFYIPSQNTPTGKKFFSVWPVGYPILIYLTSIVSQLSTFWASKILNLLVLALSFLLLRQINYNYAYVLASVYCSYTFLEIYSFTWSEAPFIFGVLYLAYLTDKIISENKLGISLILMLITCLTLFLLRYVGAFSFGVILGLAAYFFYKREYSLAGNLIITLVFGCVLAGLYLAMNHYLSGHITGFNRLEAKPGPPEQLIFMSLGGIFNELLLIRKFRAPSQRDILFYITTSIQILVVSFILYRIKISKEVGKQLKLNTFSYICFCIGALYLLSIITLRTISSFDALDHRLLSPFSFLILIGIVNFLINLPDNIRGFTMIKVVIFGFFILSLVVNLPKQYILEQIFGIR